MANVAGGGGGRPKVTTDGVTYYDEYGNVLPGYTRPIGAPVYPGINIDPETGQITQVGADPGAYGFGLPPVDTAPTTLTTSGGGGGGGYGGGVALGSMSQSELFFDWFGRYPTSAEKSVMETEGWNESTIRRAAVGAVTRSQGFKNANGQALDEERARVRIALAPFFGYNPGAVPATMVDGFVGERASSDYLSNVYGPQLKGVNAENPLAADYINAYTQLTGRVPGTDALAELTDIIKAYGFTDVGMAAWESWVKTTPAAITGNWGAEHRADISNVINSVLLRAATEAELSPNSSWWNLEGPALLEQVRASPEYQAIYAGKPAWVTEGDWLDAAFGLNAVMRWYHGDNVILNSDGSLTFPTGEYYEVPSATAQPTGTTVTPAPAVKPEWKSLTTTAFNQDLTKIGFTVEGSGPTGTYTIQGQNVAWNDLVNYLPTGVYYKDAQGYHYVQEPGAINPSTNVETPGWSPQAAAPANVTTAVPSLQRAGLTYVIPGMVADMFNNGYTPDMVKQDLIWFEESQFLGGVYDEVLVEAFGSGFSQEDWFKVASGAEGSGAMRAKLVQAQNRVAYREAYRQVFGYDPSPGDYDRITQEFVSPGELIREHQAIESADEMYDEVNDLLQRVMGQSVSKSELKDMVLGRPNSGELRALINQATKLDAYRWVHKQYYDTEPSPDDYAQYAGYSGVAELQWEIVTTERIAELGPEIQEAFRRAYGYELEPDELQAMLGEQEGYGELRKLYTKAQEEVKKEETGVQAAHQEPKTEIAYGKAALGGFETSLKPLAEL